MKETYLSISYPYVENDNIYIDPELYLEPIKLDALKPLYKLMDKDREYLSTYLPWAKNQTQESLQKFIDISIENRKQNRELVFLIKKNKDIVGCISLLQYTPSCFGMPGHANVGYYLFSDYQGRGIMKKALLALTSIYYVKHQINRFQIEIQGKNTKSIKVVESIGAKFEGIARKLRGYDDCRVYSYILPDDFIAFNQQIEQNARMQAKTPLEPLEIPGAVYENDRQSNVEFIPKASNPQDQGNVEGLGNVNIVVDGAQAVASGNLEAQHSNSNAVPVNPTRATAVSTDSTVASATSTVSTDARAVPTTPLNSAQTSSESVYASPTTSPYANSQPSSANAQDFTTWSEQLNDTDTNDSTLDNLSAEPSPVVSAHNYQQGDNLDQLVSSLEANVESQILTGGDFTGASLSQALDQGLETNAPELFPSTQNDLDDVVDEAFFQTPNRNDLEFRPSLELNTNTDLNEVDPSYQNTAEGNNSSNPLNSSNSSTTSWQQSSASTVNNKPADETNSTANVDTTTTAKFNSSVETVTPTPFSVGSTERQTPVTPLVPNLQTSVDNRTVVRDSTVASDSTVVNDSIRANLNHNLNASTKAQSYTSSSANMIDSTMASINLNSSLNSSSNPSSKSSSNSSSQTSSSSTLNSGTSSIASGSNLSSASTSENASASSYSSLSSASVSSSPSSSSASVSSSSTHASASMHTSADTNVNANTNTNTHTSINSLNHENSSNTTSSSTTQTAPATTAQATTTAQSSKSTPTTATKTKQTASSKLSTLDLAADLDDLAFQKSKIELSLAVLETEINNLNLTTQELLAQNSRAEQDLKLLEKSLKTN